jgi:hypothetical protein
MREQLYVPLDAAVGIKPGIDVIVRMPEIPGRPFPAK